MYRSVWSFSLQHFQTLSSLSASVNSPNLTVSQHIKPDLVRKSLSDLKLELQKFGKEEYKIISNGERKNIYINVHKWDFHNNNALFHLFTVTNFQLRFPFEPINSEDFLRCKWHIVYCTYTHIQCCKTVVNLFKNVTDLLPVNVHICGFVSAFISRLSEVYVGHHHCTRWTPSFWKQQRSNMSWDNPTVYSASKQIWFLAPGAMQRKYNWTLLLGSWMGKRNMGGLYCCFI